MIEEGEIAGAFVISPKKPLDHGLLQLGYVLNCGCRLFLGK